MREGAEMLARMRQKDKGDIRAMIEEWEKSGVILGRRTLVRKFLDKLRKE